ncbi:acyltransferase [Phocaeicola faecalis]|uniref:acyltransferase n=1 Tax=Phocaeicola faecalis TaxID=2786956 RepID=UPI001F1F9EF7|nr:acyltransferase [Phocaeicola faecalis]
MKKSSLKQIVCLMLYYSVAYYLPSSYSKPFGRMSNKIRVLLCRCIFYKCGKNITIERKANFGNGLSIEIGDYSGIGVNCVVPSNIIIGKYVMMGPNVYILSQNHSFNRTDIPMYLQGYIKSYARTTIEDDCWIGRNVTMTPGRHISKGCIIGACALLSKDFPEYSVVGGNPAKLIKMRK